MKQFKVVYLGDNLAGQTVLQHLLKEGVSPIARATHLLENRLDCTAKEEHEEIIRRFCIRFATHADIFYSLGCICLHSDVLTIEQLRDIIVEERDVQAQMD
jgi:hypothetical protein